jgi:hypothetical protein
MENIKLKIKLTIPGYGDSSDISQFISNDRLEELCIKFVINDKSIQEYDFWFILEDIISDSETAIVNRNNIYYLNAEVAHNILYFDSIRMKEFINQFGKCYTCFPIYSEKTISDLPFLPWMINANHGDSIFQAHQRNQNWFENYKIEFKKLNKISLFCSDRISTDEHKLRYKFVREIKKYFGENIIWYGNGVNSVSEKWEGIAPYKYHLVLENQRRNNVITEKLYDSYLGLAYPIYYGAPNVSQYFNEKSMTIIDLSDIHGARKIIATILESSTWEDNISLLYEEREKVLKKYNLFERIAVIARDSSNKKRLGAVESNTIYSSHFFKFKRNNKLNLETAIFYGERAGSRIIEMLRARSFSQQYRNENNYDF